MNEDPRVYTERLRLILSGIGQSLPVGFVLATLLFVVYWHSSETRLLAGRQFAGIGAYQLALCAWYVVFLVLRLWLVWFSRHTLRRAERDGGMPPHSVRWLMFGKVFEGLVWGALIWIGLDEQTAAGPTALLMALLAAITGNGVSLLSPIMPLYVGMTWSVLLLGSARLLSLDGLAYTLMALCATLYLAGQFGQARLSNRSIRDSIALRFANLELIERLREEKSLASAARLEAEQANQAKSRFLAAASHDLRQPVHALGLFLEALSCSRLDPGQRQILASAKAASQASAEMLNILLDFSRIEAGVIQPTLATCSLQAVLGKLEIELAPQADAKGLIYRSRETQLLVRSDPALLELILRNLISNAIRYTEHGGLLIGCRQRGERVLVEVYDTGIGIAVEQQREIFREFHQLGNPERDRRKGLGLGLAIVERLASSLGHCLSLDSRPGQGSVFRLELPLASIGVFAEAPEELAVRFDDSLGDFRVLLVDDDESVRQGMCLLLENWGCRCVAVESLEEALARDWPEPPEAIICDYRLRERKNGADAIRALRERFGAAIPALLVTGDTAPERLREASSSGIPLLHKPVPVEQLRRALEDMLAPARGQG